MSPAVGANRPTLSLPPAVVQVYRHATTESALVAILQPILHLDSNYLNIWALKLNSCCPVMIQQQRIILGNQ